MRTALRRAILTVTVAAVLAVGPAAWAQDETFGFTIDAARLADRHAVVVSGSFPAARSTPPVQASSTAPSCSDRRLQAGRRPRHRPGYVEGFRGDLRFLQTTRVDNQPITIGRR